MNPSGCGNFGNLFPLQVHQLAPPQIQRWQLFWTLGMLAVLIGYSLYRALGRRDTVILAALGAGFFAFFNEGNLEVLVHVTQSANGMFPVYYAYGMPIPAFELTGYLAVFPFVSYIAYRYLIKGISTRGFFFLWIGICLSDLLMELPATQQGLYVYQPPQVFTLLNFPLYNIWVNGTSWLLGGVLMYFFEPVLKGWKRPLISFLPAISMSWGWGFLDVPIVCALNIAGMPVWGKWLLTATSFAFSILLVCAMNSIIAADSKLRWKLPYPLLAAESSVASAHAVVR